MKRSLVVLSIAGLLTACVSSNEPLTPLQTKTRSAGMLQVAMNNCAGMLGYDGMSDAAEVRQQLIKEAKALGATDQDVGIGYDLAGTVYAVSSGLGGYMTACSSVVQSAISIISEAKGRS